MNIVQVLYNACLSVYNILRERKYSVKKDKKRPKKQNKNTSKPAEDPFQDSQNHHRKIALHLVGKKKRLLKKMNKKNKNKLNQQMNKQKKSDNSNKKGHNSKKPFQNSIVSHRANKNKKTAKLNAV